MDAEEMDLELRREKDKPRKPTYEDDGTRRKWRLV